MLVRLAGLLLFAFTFFAPLALRAQESTAPASPTLSPVYAPLAEWIVERFDLPEEGIGIDLGGGRGPLILELVPRTGLHWINADIEPAHFGVFFSAALREEMIGRVSAIYADAQKMPFHDNYADFIVSRGSIPFWDDLAAGLSEVYRVLKPGGAALIGRGFSPNLPVETARAIRERQLRAASMARILDYDPMDAAEQFRTILDDIGVSDYEIVLPTPEGEDDLNYGVWVIIFKPEEQES